MKKQPVARNIDTCSGFFWIANSIYDTCFSQLRPHGIAVYLAIARRVDHKTQTAFPSARRIADDVGMSERQVRRELRKLQELGLISVKAQTRPGSSAHTSNLYTLLAGPTDARLGKHPVTDSHAADDSGTDRHTPGCNTVTEAATDSPPARDWESPKQQSGKHNQESISTTTKSTSPLQASRSWDVDVVANELPDYLKALLETLGISGQSALRKVHTAYQENPRSVTGWALVLASSGYCELCKIKSPSGFFLHALSESLNPPLVTPSSKGT